MANLDRFFEPDGWQQGSFTSATGRSIRYGHAEPEGDKKGTVVITTGYADFIEAYHETIQEYLGRGYAVWMMDWAGQGGSEKSAGPPMKGQTIFDHINDLQQFRDTIVKADADKPVFLSTHSMGGQVALHFTQKNPDAFDGAILATPLVQMRVTPDEKNRLRAMFNTSVENGFGDQLIPGGRRKATRALTAERKGLRDDNPLRMNLHKTFMLLNDKLKAEEPTIAWSNSLVIATDKANDPAFLKSISTPVLFGIGVEDDVVDNTSILRASLLMPHAEAAQIKGGTHGLWIDRDAQRADWWSHVDGFLKKCHLTFDAKHAPPAPPAVPPSPPAQGIQPC